MIFKANEVKAIVLTSCSRFGNFRKVARAKAALCLVNKAEVQAKFELLAGLRFDELFEERLIAYDGFKSCYCLS
jgi:hypothetical protein